MNAKELEHLFNGGVLLWEQIGPARRRTLDALVVRGHAIVIEEVHSVIDRKHFKIHHYRTCTACIKSEADYGKQMEENS